jgi:hypothetical protein
MHIQLIPIRVAIGIINLRLMFRVRYRSRAPGLSLVFVLIHTGLYGRDCLFSLLLWLLYLLR